MLPCFSTQQKIDRKNDRCPDGKTVAKQSMREGFISCVIGETQQNRTAKSRKYPRPNPARKVASEQETFE